MRQSETRYRTLFEAIDEGFCIIQMLYDDAGHPVDWRFLQVNRAFELNNGLSNAEGKTIREMTPDIEPKWMEIYDLVARTGMPLRFEEESAALGRIFNLYAFRIGEPRERKVAVIFTDVTDRKRHEQRNAFLAELAEDFTINVTAEEIMRIVGEKIGRFLHISDCLFAEIDEGQDKADVRYNWHAPGLPDLAGVYRLSDFVTGEFLRMAREGEMIIINDTQTDGRVDAGRYAALHIHAYVTVPFHRGDEWKYLFTVNDSTARHWRPDEIELIEEVTRLTLPRIERARAEAELQKLNAQLEQRVLDRTEALRQSHTQLRELATHMEITREDERTRIAREVHDELGGHLTALKIELGSLSWGRETDAALNQRLSEMKAHIDEIVGIVRRIGSDLRPPVLDDYGLISAIEWHANEWERRIGIACLLDLVEDKPPLSREKRTAVFRAFQEALTNVARHANATKVNVTMALDQGELVLVIEDNGVGIQPDVLTFSNSLGLKGMQERMKEVGGEVEIEGLRGAGTVVLIRVPV
jgi:signal transduction histidine kinase